MQAYGHVAAPTRTDVEHGPSHEEKVIQRSLWLGVEAAS